MKRSSCSAALSEGLKPETCHNFRGTRQWVMCRAWEKEAEGVPFAQAISQSWDEAISRCRELGGSPGPADKPREYKVFSLIDRETGRKAGSIVLTDGDVTVCFGGDCTTTRGGERLYYIAQSFYDQLGFGIEEQHVKAELPPEYRPPEVASR